MPNTEISFRSELERIEIWRINRMSLILSGKLQLYKWIGLVAINEICRSGHNIFANTINNDILEKWRRRVWVDKFIGCLV